MLCIYKGNITWLQSEACEECRASGFQCSSTSLGALALQCLTAVLLVAEGAVLWSAVLLREVSATFLAQHICILLWSKWCRIGFSKAFDSVPVFLTNLSVTTVPSQQHVWSLSPSPWWEVPVSRAGLSPAGTRVNSHCLHWATGQFLTAETVWV